MSSSPARYFPGILARRNGNGAHNQSPERAASLTPESGVVGVPETEDSDEDLILRLQKQDVSALGLLYRRYARLVYSVCVHILRDASEAEDLVHEVFLCLYRKCKSFDPAKGSGRSWLVQLAYHKCFDWRDYLRTRHGYGQGNGEEEESAMAPKELSRRQDPANLIIWTSRMKAAFKSLSKEQQVALSLYYFKGYTFEEVAKEVGYSYGNVKHHVYRGIEHLRRIVFDGATQRSSEPTRSRMECETREMAQ